MTVTRCRAYTVSAATAVVIAASAAAFVASTSTSAAPPNAPRNACTAVQQVRSAQSLMFMSLPLSVAPLVDCPDHAAEIAIHNVLLRCDTLRDFAEVILPGLDFCDPFM